MDLTLLLGILNIAYCSEIRSLPKYWLMILLVGIVFLCPTIEGVDEEFPTSKEDCGWNPFSWTFFGNKFCPLTKECRFLSCGGTTCEDGNYTCATGKDMDTTKNSTKCKDEDECKTTCCKD